MDGHATLGRDGLASAYSYLDGVPFKIGSNFKCPQKIEIPELSSINTQSVVNVDYNYENEEAVLAWAKDREVALQQAALEQADKAKAAKNETQESSDTDSVPESSQVTGSEGAPPGGLSGEPSDVSQNRAVRPKPPIPQRPPPERKVFKPMVEPGVILKPTVASKPVSSDSEDSGGEKQTSEKKQFDLTLFEQASDPFDNAELQTINTMEELKVLLDTKPIPAPRKRTGSKGEATVRPINGDVHEELNVNKVPTNAQQNWVSFCDEPSTDIPGNKLTTFVAKPEPLFASQSCDNDSEYDYVQLRKDYNHQDVNNENVINTHTSMGLPASENSFGGNLPSNLTNSKLFKPVLPPIAAPLKKAEDDSNCNTFLPQQHLSSQQDNNGDSNPSILSNTYCSSLTAVNSNHDPSQINTQIPSQLSQGEPVFLPPALPKSETPPIPKSIPPPLPNRPERPNSTVWSSNGPTIATFQEPVKKPSPVVRDSVGQKMFGSSSDVSENQVTQQRISLNEPKETKANSNISPSIDRSKSPNLEPLPSLSPRTSQPFNPLRPLPPPPAPKPSKPPQYKPSHLPPPENCGLSDPYSQLSRDAQVFTDNLSSMGFLRARVARAVLKFGQDEREVVDHLLAVDSLVEKKFAPVLVEEALHAHKNDIAKSDKYLTMLIQFEELGFTRDNVKEALMTAEMDHDKTLDLLTS